MRDAPAPQPGPDRHLIILTVVARADPAHAAADAVPATDVGEGGRVVLGAPVGVENDSGPAEAARHTLQLLARRIQHLTEEINDLTKRITEAIKTTTSDLLDVHGVGPDSAAVLLIPAGDNPGRLGNEASFAALCGASPVEASSGKTQRRRLDRGGDRQANAALYRIVLSRLRWEGRSQDYLRRRLAEGKTKREIIRCLKRYVAREIYRLIVPTNTVANGTGPARDAA
ncbi:transposase [Streptomyces sp. sk2.1]|uniref:transposase n=1 Tax=Streptomyces sp. sk2.1 TaxID=2478959 RepID=UPI0037DD8E75